MKRTLFIVFLILINIVLDQVSKFWVRASVTKGSKSEIIGDYFTLHNVENSGAFLGMGSDLAGLPRVLFLLLIPSAVMAYVLFYVFKNKNLEQASVIGFSCIIGGGMANVYDRFVYGSVTDFFFINLGGVFKTGIFNIADMSVMLGLGLLLFDAFNAKKKLKIKNENNL
ncbi:MAG: signal peptidase II [Oceanihabitans sp.]